MKLASLAVAAAALFCAATSAMADSYPSKPINMIVGYGAGGSVDIQARGLAEQLSKILGQPVNILNQPGAGAAVAATQLSKAAPDGYTIMFDNSSTLTFTPLVTPVDFKPADFKVIASVAQSQPAFVVHGPSPIKSFDDVIAMAKDKGSVSYVTQSQVDRLIMTALAKQKGINVRIVPTKGGGEMQGLVLGDQVDFAYSGGLHINFLDSGQMRVIASLNSQPLVATPDAPTLSKLGLDYGIDNYRIVMTPAGVSDEVAAKLQEAVLKAANTPEFNDLTTKKLQFPIVILKADELAPRLVEAEAKSRSLVEQAK